ncbi:MAG TPA: hypothetical protein VGM57_15000 [Pseudolabrys sp.]
MRGGSVQIHGLMVLALGFAPGVALAQDNPWLAITPNADYAVASPSEQPEKSQESLQESAKESADAELTPAEQDALRNILDNAPTVNADAPAKQLRTPALKQTKKFDMSSTNKADGSSNLTLKQPLPIDWDATVGTDLGLRNAPSITNSPDPWSSGSRDQRGSGAAWASVGLLPNLATVDARVDPSNDQGRVGTTFKYTKPVGSNFSVTLQNTYSVTETFSASSAAPSDFPMMAVPTPTGLATPQVWGSEKAAKFDYLPTGTSFGAKVATSSTDPVTHNQFVAEQKVYGPLNVTTAVTDVGQTGTSKSISARFKLNW